MHDPASLGSLIPDWEALAAGALEPNPFNEHWLLLPALKAYAGGRDIRCLTIRIDGKLAGLFPLERVARYKGLPIGTLRSWRHRHTLVSTPLILAEHAVECLTALFQWMGSAQSVPEFLEFDHVPGDGPFYRALEQALAQTAAAQLTTYSYERALLRRSRDAGTYLKSALSARTRKKLDRYERGLSESGAVQRVGLQPHEDAGEGGIGKWIEDFLKLEASGWKGRNGTALACREVDRRFAIEAFTAAYQRGRLQVAGIDLDSRPIARGFGFLAGEGAFAFKVAYDEGLARFAPGILMECDWIRRFHEVPGVQWMDSLTGPGNEVLDRLWKDKRRIVTMIVGVGARGRGTVSAIAALRKLKHKLASLARFRLLGRHSEPSMHPAREP